MVIGDSGMEYTHLGTTGLEVSKICLGSAQFGSGTRPDENWEYPVDREKSLEIIDRALEHGINFIDTANTYSTGESERIIGDAIEGRRDELVISSKVRGPMTDRPNAEGLSRKHILEQANASLDRLGTDYLDLYQAHSWDEHTPIEETLAAFDTLVERGAVHYIGASNFTGWQLMKSLSTCDLRGYERIVGVEQEYSLIAREEEYKVLPVCEDQDIGVMVYSPLAAGFLAGAYDPDEGPGSDSRLTHRPEIWERLNTDENWTVYDRVTEVADRKDATAVQVSIAWLLENDLVDSVIIGPENVDQLDEYVSALDISLTTEENEWLEEPVNPSWPPR